MAKTDKDSQHGKYLAELRRSNASGYHDPRPNRERQRRQSERKAIRRSLAGE